MDKLQESKYKLLSQINSPEDLRKLSENELPKFSEEVRDYMIDVITKTGGHFGAGLGVVELTVSLHYVYNTPKDKLIWDVGHQGYPHKIITGRRDKLHTIRKHGGISGFLKRSESPFDEYGAGHASTSISAALGIATARDLNNDDHKVVSIIGDGAMTGGLAFEALNNCGVQGRDILVILNDNDISIAPNVSAISNYFNELYASTTVQRLRDNIWDFAGKMDDLGDRIRNIATRLEDGVKAIVTPGVLFEAFGFNYFGPIDGNRTRKIIKILRQIKDIKGPVFLHILTRKGKGYAPAESDNKALHAIGKIDRETGKSLSDPKIPKPKSYSKIFGETMLEFCKKDPKLVAITAAMSDGTGLNILQDKMPERVFDVGIAEGHAVTFAAGLASQGITPVVAIYSTFLQRAYDIIIHDCALQNLHVVFAIDRGGLVGADGPTHHGVLDLSYLRSIQNITLMAPKDEQELRDMMYTAIYDLKNGPVAIRYPRGTGMGTALSKPQRVALGEAEILRKGNDIAIFAIGKMVDESLKAAEKLSKLGIEAEIVNARFVKPLDLKMIENLAYEYENVITVEDGQELGGFGSAVLEELEKIRDRKAKLTIMGIPDEFVTHGTQEELHKELGLDAEGISRKCLSILSVIEEKSEEVHFDAK